MRSVYDSNIMYIIIYYYKSKEFNYRAYLSNEVNERKLITCARV